MSVKRLIFELLGGEENKFRKALTCHRQKARRNELLSLFTRGINR